MWIPAPSPDLPSASTARRKIASYQTFDETSPFDTNKEFEDAGQGIIDFSEGNPFGDFWC